MGTKVPRKSLGPGTEVGQVHFRVRFVRCFLYVMYNEAILLVETGGEWGAEDVRPSVLKGVFEYRYADPSKVASKKIKKILNEFFESN